MPASITAVIPACNEAARIAPVIRETLPHVSDVLVIDDGSTDETRAIAEDAGARVVSNQFDKGYIGGLKTGFQQARGEIVVTLDADGEHDPSEILELAAPILHDEADLVLGRRAEIARPSERLINALTNLRVRVRDSGTGYRALRADLARSLELRGRCTCGTFVLEAVHRGARLAEVPVTLRSTEKPRKWAWGHAEQILHVLAWIRRIRS
ncbi:MAG: glycosyltransferase family 2 protein [Salinibacter sp.]